MVKDRKLNRHKPQKCNLCDYTDRHSKLGDHTEWHAKQAKKRFLCINCARGFMSMKELNRHHKNVHKKPSGQDAHHSKTPPGGQDGAARLTFRQQVERSNKSEALTRHSALETYWEQ
jgi:hypothetical protein